MDSLYLSQPAHSRDSSAESSLSSPITPTFSARGHSRWPSSNSSLLTSPDSPVAAPAMAKCTLDDLVEDPDELDDVSFRSEGDYLDEPLCICDTTLCVHRQHAVSHLSTLSLAEWTPGDDYLCQDRFPREGEPIAKRRKSAGTPADRFTSRLNRRISSFSKRLPSHRPDASRSNTQLRSAPVSRTSSLKLASPRSVTAPALEDAYNVATPPFSPAATEFGERSVSPPRSRAASRARAVSSATSRPLDIAIRPVEEDPIDRDSLARTPLLPPMLAEYFNRSSDSMQSPLQSPTVASPGMDASFANTPTSTPLLPGFPTPPLSAKPSLASLRKARSGTNIHPTSDIPPLVIDNDSDQWAARLGHANFHIHPEPYLPEVCDAQSCKLLAHNWETARVEYMCQAAVVREHYGITSQIYKLTEQKWAEIDAVWRANHEAANAEAQANGESPLFQPLAEVRNVQAMPSLNDPQQPSKFPAIEDKDIVGPMVRYAKIHRERPQPKKPSFLKLFTDPASLLGGGSRLTGRR